MAQLPIRKMTLWKQGIGYFERRGTVNERTISLIVAHDATNDVLKSLNIVVHQGSPVLSVDYETPEEKSAVLKDLAVKLTERASLVDLLVSLRGSSVSLLLDNSQTVSGRLVGVEASLDQPPTVILQGQEAAADQLHILPIARLQGVTLQERRSAQDVSFFLDVSQLEQTRSTLTIQVGEGDHDLELGYLAPSPTWRVSYRLVRVSDSEALLTGWGLFENTLEEDLNDVSLTLISGRPISFVYDLYNTSTPPRPEVADNEAALQQLSGDPRVAEAMATISHDLRSPLSTMRGFASLIQMEGSLSPKQQQHLHTLETSIDRMNNMIGDLLSLVRVRDTGAPDRPQDLASFYRSGPLGDLKVSGRYFSPVLMSNAEESLTTYPVESPVTVRRGQSAMVPILRMPLALRPLVVYNSDKMPNHPLKVWEFRNSSDRALEQGPVTIIDGGYVGEGLLRFTGVGDTLQIPYALAVEILVSEERTQIDPTLHALRFDPEQRSPVVSRAQITNTLYTLTSRTTQPMTVYIERRDIAKTEYFQMAESESTDMGHTRWSVDVPAKQTVQFTVSVRTITDTKESIERWTREKVEDLRGAGLLTDASFELLQAYFTSQETVRDAQAEMNTLTGEFERIQTLQEQLRKNLSALGTSEREAKLRDQLLNDLERSENRRREIEARLDQLRAQMSDEGNRQTELTDRLFAVESSA